MSTTMHFRFGWQLTADDFFEIGVYRPKLMFAAVKINTNLVIPIDKSRAIGAIMGML